MPTRIAFCITELDAGGAERAFVRVVLGLDRSVWSPVVFSLQDGGALRDELERAGVPVESFGLRSGWQAPTVLGRLTRRLREFQPALLQTWLYHANLLGRIAGWRAGVPRIVAGHRVAERRSRWRLRLDRWTDRLVDRHVCVGQAVADFMRDEAGLPSGKLVVIPNGVDFERFAHATPADLGGFGIPPQVPTVLFVGRLDPQKEPLLFLDAAARFSQVVPSTHFLMVGEGPLRSVLEGRIRALGLKGQVHLAGQRSDVPALLKASWCFVLTSRWEGMANVVLEAMAAGCPVVATDVEGVREVVTPDETGLIVPPGDAPAIAAALQRLHAAPTLPHRLSATAQTVVQENFTWDRCVASHAALYRELVFPR